MRRGLLLLAAIIGLAFALRIYRLDAVPLRGDEAFAVRYWAAPPSEVVSDLARREPHPLGTFFGFWAWKTLAGDSEFAMRYLPLLGSLIGTAAVAALAQRLYRSRRIAALVALLWAVNPFLIWHAQDVRNYALWAGISPLAMWLFLRAATTNRPRAWAFYVLAEAVAAYLFFLEAFMLVVQAAYLLAYRRPALRRALIAWAALALLLIPWFIQLGYLAQSGYEGTTRTANPSDLLFWFLPTLLIGRDYSGPWHTYIPAFLLLALIVQVRRRTLWLAAWILIPTALLLLAATRMSVFHPRYLIAITPALLLIGVQFAAERRTWLWALTALPLLLIPGVLADYYRAESPKSPDWPALVAYLDSRAQPGDLILQVSADPAFRYYYHGVVAETSLSAARSLPDQLDEAMHDHAGIWLVGRSFFAESYVRDHWQELSTHSLSGFTVIQYRPWIAAEDEIAVKTDVIFSEGDTPLVRLRGYTLQGPDPATHATTLLLYWEPLANVSTGYHVFVHLIRPGTPLNGIARWNQDDHPPFGDFLSTTHWADDPSALRRDAYHLLDDPARALDPGRYEIRVGFYDPANPTARLPVTAADGTPLGDTYTLPGAIITAPLP